VASAPAVTEAHVGPVATGDAGAEILGRRRLGWRFLWRRLILGDGFLLAHLLLGLLFLRRRIDVRWWWRRRWRWRRWRQRDGHDLRLRRRLARALRTGDEERHHTTQQHDRKHDADEQAVLARLARWRRKRWSRGHGKKWEV